MSKFLKGACVLAALAVGTVAVNAQDSYPRRPITIINPWAAGGINDVVVRLVTDHMSKTLGQPLVIENRGGGGSKIGTEMVLNAPKDGYTILFQNVVHAILPTVAAPLNYDPINSFIPIAQATLYSTMMVVHPSVPANTLPEFIDYAKKNPGKLSYGSGGPGSGIHFAGEMLKIMGKLDIVHVPYKGMSGAVQDTLAGHVQFTFDSTAKSAIDAGKLKALGTTGLERDPRFPDVPAIAEIFPGYRFISWQGFMAPAGVPSNVIARLNAAANAALSDPTVKARFAELGLAAVGGTPENFATTIREDIELFRRIATEAKMTFN
jgi:tripartite-type tricarboxylate transporter receptor subunit TctC